MPCLDVQILTADGASNGTLHVPDPDGPWPGVLVFPDAGGVRETFRQMGDHLAGMGYAALIPDIYYRAGQWARVTRPRPPRGGRTRPAAAVRGSRCAASR